jgi:hypothetical protein
MQVLDSLARQTVRPNKIYINLPYKSKRTGAEYVVPSYLSRYEDVEVLRSEDYGPLTKLSLNVMLSWCLLFSFVIFSVFAEIRPLGLPGCCSCIPSVR